jgi:type I site-specific restriction endonuclease
MTGRHYARAAVLALIVAWAWIDALERHQQQALPVMATPSGVTRVLELPGDYALETP